MWQPEGQLWKLGKFPCYDPSKVPLEHHGFGGHAWQLRRWSSAAEHPCVENGAPTGRHASCSEWPRLLLTCCPARRCRPCKVTLLPPLLPLLPATQDMVLPVMYSPQKYRAAPFLGAPPRERKYLAVFKGAPISGLQGAQVQAQLVGGCSSLKLTHALPLRFR